MRGSSFVRTVAVVTFVASGIAVGSTGCGGAPSTPSTPLNAGPTTGEAFEGVQCSAVRPQTEPDLMAWDSGSRALLSAVQSQGVAVVHYEAQGCNVSMRVLPNCVAKGSYTFAPYSATETKLARNASELYAELPLGAASLSGKLKGTRAIRTDYMLAGVEQVKIGTTFKIEELIGDCGDATHVVTKIYLGGFGLAAGETQDLEAKASIFSLGAGGSTSGQVEHLQHEGSAKACEDAQEKGTPSPMCAVPLRVALLTLTGAKPAVAEAPNTTPVVARIDPSGCSDGQRDGFVDRAAFPRIAGCFGTWGRASTRAPKSGTACGDDAKRGCNTPADLCATGWHVCGLPPYGPADVSGKLSREQCVGEKTGIFVAALADQKCDACGTEGGFDAVCCGVNCTGGTGSCVWNGATPYVGMIDSHNNLCSDVMNESYPNGMGALCCAD